MQSELQFSQEAKAAAAEIADKFQAEAEIIELNRAVEEVVTRLNRVTRRFYRERFRE